MTDHAGVMCVSVPLPLRDRNACQYVFGTFPTFSFKAFAFYVCVDFPGSFQQGFQLFNTPTLGYFPKTMVFPHGFPQSVENSVHFSNTFGTQTARQKPKMIFVQDVQKAPFFSDFALDNRRMPKFIGARAREKFTLFTKSSLFPDENVVY